MLQDDAVGAYLHGSTGLGRLQPQSDLDVLVVSAVSLDDSRRSALTELLLEASPSRRASSDSDRYIELTVVAVEEIRPWRYPPLCDFLYGEWLRDWVEAGNVLQPFVCPDLAVLTSMARQCDAPLFGPSARLAMDVVPSDDLVRASLAAVPGLVDDIADDTTNVLLTLARVWRTCATGDIVAKDMAADWAVERLPADAAAVLRHARAVYRGEEDEKWASLACTDTAATQLIERIHTVEAGTG